MDYPPEVVTPEIVDGLITMDFTPYEPLEFKQLPQVQSAELNKLQVLKVFSNYLSEVPSYQNLTSLQQYFLYCNSSKSGSGLSSLPSHFGQLSQLRLLNLVGNKFLSFPDCLCRLDGLTTLHMNSCNLSRIPEEICNMKSLLEIDLSDNDFSCQGSLPTGLFLLPQLKDLYLAKCRLQSLPPEVENLKNLEVIRLGKNKLSELPEEFYNLKKLKKLYAENNKLRRLSPKVAQLNELVYVNLIDNRLTCIPRSITEMEKLCDIQLDQNNYLQQPPLDVCLKGLEQIKGYFDSFADPLLNPIHCRRLKIILLGQSEAGKSCLTYALINAAAKPPSPTNDESTVGVEVYSWRPSLDGIEFKIMDCAGQCGYQLTHPFFLSEGALHLVVFNLYMYKKTDASFKENIGDWLDLVSYRVSKPRIMIVPTHLDKFLSSETKCVIDKCNHIMELVKNYQERQARLLDYEIAEIRRRDDYQRKKEQLDKLTWQQEDRPVISSVLKYCEVELSAPCSTTQDSYIAMVPVSNKEELVGMMQLRQEITRTALDPKLFPSVGRNLPPSWVALEKALQRHREAGKTHLWPYENFEAFALEHSGLQGPTLGSAVQYFDAIGELKYYKGIPSLHINVFLDLEWLAKLIKLVFRHDHKTSLRYKVEYLSLNGQDEQEFEDLSENLENDALLSIKLLRCIWMEMELSGKLFDGMVNLLQHFGLVCKVPDTTQLFVPWFLEKISETQRWPDDPPLEHVEVKLMISTLRYMPPALFDRLRVKVCSIAQEQDNWDKGMLLHVNTVMVRVQCVQQQQSPAITLCGRSPKKDLSKLWEVLLRIVQEAHDLLKEWKRLIVRNYSLCPSCGHCRFEFNWLRTGQPDLKPTRNVQCRKIMPLGGGIDVNLICPPVVHLLPEVTLQPKSCVVGSDGAELSYYGCTVSIPAGALEEDTEIKISLIVLNTYLSELVASPLLKLEPSNLTFKRPVKVTLPLVVSPSPAVPEAEWPELTLMCYAEEKWSKVHTAKFTFGNWGSFECTHFSAYFFVPDGSGQTKLVKRLTCLLYKESRPIQQGTPIKVTVAICDDLPDVTEQLEIRLREKGLHFVDGGQTLCVQRGSKVTVQVNFNAAGVDAKVEPTSWVLSLTDVWVAFLKKFQTFCVTGNAVGHNVFELRFDVRSESGSEVKLCCPLETIDKSPARPAPEKTKNHLLFLAQTWGWAERDGPCSTSNEMAVQFAKNEGVKVSCLVANTTKDLHDKAKQQNVQLFSARCMKGFSALECLSFPPDNVAFVDAIVGYGKLVGRHAQPIKLKYTNSKWIHIVHSSFAVEDEGDEIHFCQKSDLTVAIGVNVTEVCERQLRFCRKMVHGFTPGILKEFQVYPQSNQENAVFSVITFYPSATELNAGKEIYSIPAKAVRCLSQSEGKVQLICICAPGDNPDEVKKILQQLQIPIENSILRSHCESLDKRCRTLVGADLLILPYLTSKFDDFGLIALQAVSTDLPILVTENAGLGKALKEVPNGDASVVNSDRPEDWARRISTVKGKTRNLRLLEATIRRESYDKIYPWEGQCEEVLNKILQVV